MLKNEKLEFLKPSDDEKIFNEFVEKTMAKSNEDLKKQSFRFITSRRSEPCHVAFEFPGKYLKKVPVEVHTVDGKTFDMDYAEVVLPQDEIGMKTAVDVELLQEEPDDIVLEKMLYSGTDLICKTNLPYRTVAITNIKPEKPVMCYEYKGFYVIVHYIYVCPEKISDRLDTLQDIISAGEILVEDDAMGFPYVAIFADENAKEIMEKLAELFTQIKNMDSSLKVDICHVLADMIKYHFDDDTKKAEELLYRLTKTLTSDEFHALFLL